MSDFDDLFGDWATETIVVRDRAGIGAEGVIFSAPQTVAGVFVEHKRRLVRSNDGREIVSESTIYAPRAAHVFVEGSRVDTADGRRSEIVAVALQPLDDVFDHWVVNLA